MKKLENMIKSLALASAFLFSPSSQLYSGLPKPLGVGTGANVTITPQGPYKEGDTLEVRITPKARPVQGARIKVNGGSFEELQDNGGIYIKNINLKEAGQYSLQPEVLTDKWRSCKKHELNVSENSTNPGSHLTYTISKSEGEIYSGANIFASVSFSTNVAEVESAQKSPPNTSYSAYFPASKTGNEYKDSIATNGFASDAFGNYSFKFRYKEKSSDAFIDISSEAVIPVRMSESQSDDILYNKCLALKVSSITAVDGQIIEVKKNWNHVVGGNLYNNDVELTIRDSTVGGNQRGYLIDVQGSSGDTYNSTKYNDAKASSVSYDNVSSTHTLSKSVLEDKIQELNANKWKRTD